MSVGEGYDAPKTTSVLVSEQAKSSGLLLGKGGVKVLLKFRTQPCQPGLWDDEGD